MNKEIIKDFTLRITHANKTEMIVILYDIALEYIKDAKEALRAEDKANFRVEIHRLQDTLNELKASVNTSGELGMTIMRLYIFCSAEISRALTNYDGIHLNNVEEVLKPLADSYRQICSKDQSAPIMENTEKIYSGFTYNPYGKTTDVSDSSFGRGILA